jgi:hypothetical protein
VAEQELGSQAAEVKPVLVTLVSVEELAMLASAP